MGEISEGELKGKRIKYGNFGNDHISKEKDEKKIGYNQKPDGQQIYSCGVGVGAEKKGQV